MSQTYPHAVGEFGSREIPAKRTFFPKGITIFDKCNKCGNVVEEKLSKHYMTQPYMNGGEYWYTLYMYCDKCDSEWELEFAYELRIDFNGLA